jgi:hypothetical protein
VDLSAANAISCELHADEQRLLVHAQQIHEYIVNLGRGCEGLVCCCSVGDVCSDWACEPLAGNHHHVFALFPCSAPTSGCDDLGVGDVVGSWDVG